MLLYREVTFMKKWYLFSVPLSLILAFVAVPLIQLVHANANIRGTAKLRLAESYSRMNKEKKEREVVDCNKDGFEKCLLLRYNISGIEPGSAVKIGLHEDSCQGRLKENLEQNNIPVGDGRDGREIRASVKFTELPNKRKWFFCVFNVKDGKDTRIAQGKFTVAGDRLTAQATVAPA